MVILLILLPFIILLIVYILSCYKKDPYNTEPQHKPQHEPQHTYQQEPPRENITVEEESYYPAGYGPQRYGAHYDYLPNSLYTGDSPYDYNGDDCFHHFGHSPFDKALTPRELAAHSLE